MLNDAGEILFSFFKTFKISIFLVNLNGYTMVNFSENFPGTLNKIINYLKEYFFQDNRLFTFGVLWYFFSASVYMRKRDLNLYCLNGN